jgi:hypothetical protein
MPNRTKGFSINWGGHRAAQQLIAETGRIEGEGRAALLGGIAAGVAGAIDTTRARQAQAKADAKDADREAWRRDMEEAALTGYLPERGAQGAAGVAPAAAPAPVAGRPARGGMT